MGKKRRLAAEMTQDISSLLHCPPILWLILFRTRTHGDPQKGNSIRALLKWFDALKSH